MAKFTCKICGKEATGLAKIKTLDGHLVCAHCAVEKSKPYKLPAQRLTLAQLQGLSDTPVLSAEVSAVAADSGENGSITPAIESSNEKGKKAKPRCAICGGEIGFLQKMSTADGNVICFTCYKSLGIPIEVHTNTLTLAEIKEYGQRNQKNAIEYKDFQLTKKICDYLHIDEVHKKWLIPTNTRNAPSVYNYSDIVSFELIQNNSQNDASLGSALLQLDAVVNPQDAAQDTAMMIGRDRGFCNNLQIGITIKSMLTPVVFINFINSQVQTNSFVFKERLTEAKECLGVLKLISDEVKVANKAPEPVNNIASSADELLKFKQLLDMGAITQEEFDAKKKQLLGL